MLSRLKAIARVAQSLERIAAALEYFALNDAQKNNRMFMPANRRPRFVGKDESELMHTDDTQIRIAQEEDLVTFLQRGYKGLDAQEESD